MYVFELGNDNTCNWWKECFDIKQDGDNFRHLKYRRILGIKITGSRTADAVITILYIYIYKINIFIFIYPEINIFYMN